MYNLFNDLKKGAVVWANFKGDEDSYVQSGERPAIIISNDKANENSPVVTVAPLTSAKRKYLPVHVPVYTQGNELRLKTLCLVEQMRTLDKKDIIKYISQVTDDCLAKIDEAIKIQLALQ